MHSAVSTGTALPPALPLHASLAASASGTQDLMAMAPRHVRTTHSSQFQVRRGPRRAGCMRATQLSRSRDLCCALTVLMCAHVTLGRSASSRSRKSKRTSDSFYLNRTHGFSLMGSSGVVPSDFPLVDWVRYVPVLRLRLPSCTTFGPTHTLGRICLCLSARHGATRPAALPVRYSIMWRTLGPHRLHRISPATVRRLCAPRSSAKRQRHTPWFWRGVGSLDTGRWR